MQGKTFVSIFFILFHKFCVYIFPYYSTSYCVSIFLQYLKFMCL